MIPRIITGMGWFTSHIGTYGMKNWKWNNDDRHLLPVHGRDMGRAPDQPGGGSLARAAEDSREILSALFSLGFSLHAKPCTLNLAPLFAKVIARLLFPLTVV
jgi:hypothetical protein